MFWTINCVFSYANIVVFSKIVKSNAKKWERLDISYRANEVLHVFNNILREQHFEANGRTQTGISSQISKSKQAVKYEGLISKTYREGKENSKLLCRAY